MRIGLLPEVNRGRIEMLGNTAIEGATRVLVSALDQRRIEEWVRRVEHVELEKAAGFFDLYAQGCLLRPLHDRSVAEGEVS